MAEFSTKSRRRRSATSCFCPTGNNHDCEMDCLGKRINASLQSISDEISNDGPHHHLLQLKIFRDVVSRFHTKILKDIEKLEQRENSNSSSFVSVDSINLTFANSTRSGERRLSPIGEDGGIHVPGLQNPTVNLNPNQPEVENEPESTYQNEMQNCNNTEFQPIFQTEEQQLHQSDDRRNYHMADQHPYNSEEQSAFQSNRPKRFQISESSSSDTYEHNSERREWNRPMPLLRINHIKRFKDLFATSDLLYVSDGSRFITSTKIQNGVQQKMSVYKRADFITATSKVLYFTNCREKKVMQFEDNHESFLYSLPQWTPYGLAMWGDDKIYICMFNKDKRKGKVVLFKFKNFKLVVEKEIEYKKDSSKFFSHPKFIAVNSKGGVCVSDHLKKCVISVTAGCTIRFKYEGAYSGKTRPFDPEGLSCDRKDNVYIADKNNNCVDIVNPNGHWLDSIYIPSSPKCVALNKEDIYITLDIENDVGRIRIIPIPELRIIYRF